MTTPTQNLRPSDVWDTDGNGRRLIPDADGKIQRYTRVSTFAGTLSDKSALKRWAAWKAVVGAQQERAEPLIAECLTADTTPGSAVEQLVTLGGGSEKANKGSDRHEIVAHALAGYDMSGYPEQARQEINAVCALVRSLGTLTATEQPIVTDTFKVAGTCDYLLTDPDGRTVVADLKTGSKIYLLDTAIQMYAYAAGVLWDARTRTRGEPVSRDLATTRLVVVWAPQDGRTPRLVTIDTAEAKAAAELARDVRAARSAFGRWERQATK